MTTNTEVDRKEIALHLTEAAYHLAACWDALREIEDITGAEVETDNGTLQSLAADCECPAARRTVDDDEVERFLGEL